MIYFPPVNPLPLTQWKRNLLAVSASAALFGAGFTLVMPFLPIYVQQLGIHSKTSIAIWCGLLLGITPLIAALVGPFWGRIADRYGLKIMAIRISVVSSLIWLLMGLARDVYELFVLRILSGFFGGFGSLSVSLATHWCPNNRVSRAIGSLQATQTFSMALGPFVGGMLAVWIGIQNTFFVTAVLSFLTLLVFFLLYRDKPVHQTRRSHPVSHQFKAGLPELFRLPTLKVFALLLFTLTVIDRTFAPTIPLFITSISNDSVEVARVAGLILSLAALAESFSSWYAGRKVISVSPRQLLLLRFSFGLLICFALTFAKSSSDLLILRLLLAFLAGGTLTITYSLANRVIPSGQRASSFALLSSFAMLGNAVGPLLGGFMASFYLHWVFLGNTFLYIGLFCLVYQTVRE